MAGVRKSSDTKVCITCLQYASKIMLTFSCARQQTQRKSPFGVSIERLRRGTGRSLVLAHHPGHDAARISHLQGISAKRRGNRDEHIGRSPAQSRKPRNNSRKTEFFGPPKNNLLPYTERQGSRARSHGNGFVGCGARKNAKSGSR